jgi:MFS family permease
MTTSNDRLPNIPIDEPETLEDVVRERSRSSDLLVLMSCNLIVFMASVCIMVLELTASRLIAKHVGSSLYTWTSVIGVVLAGITVGNYLGGWLADKFAPRRMLSWLFFASSLLCFSVLWLDQIVGEISRPDSLDWPTWVLCQVASVFLLPAVALGTISPVVASLALSRSTRTGITVGNVYAWGALGSIVGTFLTGFYLIDMFGTKSIVGMVSATLAIMGILVASGQRAFRAAVLFGWLQFIFVFGLAASIETEALSEFMDSITTTSSDEDRNLAEAEQGGDVPTDWAEFGGRLGASLHELGMILGLRDDSPDEYHDESSYSYVNVSDAEEDGDKIKTLRLDKLIHSYYNPRIPTTLYYDYEELYAAVTERVAADWNRTVSVELPNADELDTIIKKLPDWVHFDTERNTLESRGALNREQHKNLLQLSPVAFYWKAVNELFESSQDASWSGFAAADLDHLPEGVRIPQEWIDSKKVQFDLSRRALITQSVLTEKERDRLLGLGPAGDYMEYYRAVEELYGRSRQVSTFFIGGGGFVFPRWIEAKFPFQPRIDVAELDPAVKLAVQREMGLPADADTFVNTYIGDARNVVDDRLQHNDRLVSDGKPPVLYDFVYGDAFNDFSVPWHLTTREFSEKIQRLLSPEGVYMINVIDIYPRTSYPKGKKSFATSRLDGDLPNDLLDNNAESDRWSQATEPHDDLEVFRGRNGQHKLRYNATMRVDQYAALKNLSDNGDHRAAIEALYFQSNAFAAIEGQMPDALLDSISPDQEWQACTFPFQSVELKPLDEEAGYRMAVRGAMSEELRKRLTDLAKSNAKLKTVIDDLYERSQKHESGRFLAAFVNTIAQVFPNVYVFSSDVGVPHAGRDTFIVIGAQRPVNMANLTESDSYWYGHPFAWVENGHETSSRRIGGQMTELAHVAHGMILTDDYAPVDNLLSPVFRRQRN